MSKIYKCLLEMERPMPQAQLEIQIHKDYSSYEFGEMNSEAGIRKINLGMNLGASIRKILIRLLLWDIQSNFPLCSY